MLPPLDYLAWARRHYAHIDFDLATSGVASLGEDELVALVGGARPALDDADAPARLARAVAARYGVEAERVVPTLGASGGIWVTFAATLSPGDEVLVESPRYEPLVRVAAGLGASVRTFARDPARRFAFDPESVLAAVGPKTRVVALTSPHNPSGIATSDDDLATLARGLEARGVLLFVDEVYRELFAARTTAARLGPNVAVTSSLTKCFGVGWARAGFVVLPREHVEAAVHATTHATGELPRAQAALGALGFAHADAILEVARARQVGQRALVDAFAARHAGELEFSEPPASAIFGYFAAKRRDGMRALVERAIADERVIVAPGEFFGGFEGFRVSWARPVAVVAEGLARLERALAR